MTDLVVRGVFDTTKGELVADIAVTRKEWEAPVLNAEDTKALSDIHDGLGSSVEERALAFRLQLVRGALLRVATRYLVAQYRSDEAVRAVRLRPSAADETSSVMIGLKSIGIREAVGYQTDFASIDLVTGLTDFK